MRKQDPEKFCSFCKSRLKRKRYNGILEDFSAFLRRKYCNRFCMANGQFKETKTRDGYRKYAKRFKKNSCERCNTKIRLQIHHKDRDWSNNKLQNLETLCATCHMKEHWNAGDIPYKKKGECKICHLPTKGFGFCQKHYQRLKRNGDPLKIKMKTGKNYEIFFVDN